jgi:hypothetical protein
LTKHDERRRREERGHQGGGAVAVLGPPVLSVDNDFDCDVRDDGGSEAPETPTDAGMQSDAAADAGL